MPPLRGLEIHGAWKLQICRSSGASRLPSQNVKEPTFAKATVGRPASAKIPARQAFAHRARILVYAVVKA